MFAQIVLLIANALGLILTVLLLSRFFMQVFRVPFSNRLGDLALQLTNWLVLPLRKIIPPVRKFDSACIVPAYLLQVFLLVLVVLFNPSLGPFTTDTLLQIAVNGLKSLLHIIIYLFILLLVIQAILSWFKPEVLRNHPVNLITAPLLRPLRRIVPPVANTDLTPLIAVLIAQIVLLIL